MDNIQNIFKRWQFYSYPQMYQIPKCKHVLREKYSYRPPFSNMPYLTKPGPGLSLSPTNMQNLLSLEAVTACMHWAVGPWCLKHQVVANIKIDELFFKKRMGN